MKIPKASLVNSINRINKKKLLYQLPVATLPIIACMKSDKIPDGEPLDSFSKELPKDLDLEDLTNLIVPIDISDIPVDEFTEMATVTDMLEKFPLSESIAGLSLLLKAKEPIEDLCNGKNEAGLMKARVRILETSILPVKYAWATCKGIKGVILSLKGIEHKDAGFMNGFKSGLLGWVRNRRLLEKILSDDNYVHYSDQEIYEKYLEAKEKYIGTLKKHYQDIGAKYTEQLKDWQNKNLQYHQYMSLNLIRALKNENERIEAHEKQLGNLFNNNDINEQDFQKDLEKIKGEKDSLEIKYQNFIKKIRKSLSHLQDEKLISQKIDELSQNAKIYFKKRNEKLTQEIDKINNILYVYAKLKANNKYKNLNNVAGYETIKTSLRESFLKPLEEKKNGLKANIPNMILLYGPKGCGKTLISDAIQNESGCEVINLDLSLEPKEDFNALIDSINIAEKNKKHTIIRIEELDGFLSNFEISDGFTKILNNLSVDKNCTIIATTNYPQNINKQIIPSNNYEEIYVPYASKKNIQEVLKYYIEDFALPSVNYEKLSEKILEKTHNNAYSNAKLINCISNGIKSKYVLKGKLSQEDFTEILDKSYPDIGTEMINLYKMKG